MSLKQRVARLEKELESKMHLPIMVWHEGRREESLARYLAEHGREPDIGMQIRFIAPKVENC